MWTKKALTVVFNHLTSKVLKNIFYLARLSGKRTNKYRAKYIRPNTIDVLNTVGVVVCACGWTKVLFLDRCGSSLKDKSPKVHFYKQNLTTPLYLYISILVFVKMCQICTTFCDQILQINFIKMNFIRIWVFSCN